MAQDINIVALVGRLTSDPELRALASGTSVCSLRLAFNTSIRDNSTGAWEDKGNFINVTVWGGQGENCAKFLSKGSKVAIDGALQWREWDSEQGKRSEVSIKADRVQFLDTKQEGQGGHRQAQSVPAGAPAADDSVPF
jgi:single-strand DNA-binding protein